MTSSRRKKSWVNCYIITIFYTPRLLQVSPHTHTELRQKLKKAEHKTAFCPETNTSNCFARIFMMSQDIIHIGNAKIHTICGTTLYINKGILSFFFKNGKCRSSAVSL